MQGRLIMMPSSSQVLDHQLIFHIMFGLGQFHHRQNKGEERRGEGRFGKTYGVGQFHHRQKRREEVRVYQKKAAAGCQKNRAAATKHRSSRSSRQKTRSSSREVVDRSSREDRSNRSIRQQQQGSSRQKIEVVEVVYSISNEVVEVVDRSRSS